MQSLVCFYSAKRVCFKQAHPLLSESLLEVHLVQLVAEVLGLMVFVLMEVLVTLTAITALRTRTTFATLRTGTALTAVGPFTAVTACWTFLIALGLVDEYAV